MEISDLRDFLVSVVLFLASFSGEVFYVVFGGFITVIVQRLTLQYNHKKSFERFRKERFEFAVAEFLISLDALKQEASKENFHTFKSKGFLCKAWGSNNISVLIDDAVQKMALTNNLHLGWDDYFLLAVKQELGCLKEYSKGKLNPN